MKPILLYFIIEFNKYKVKIIIYTLLYVRQISVIFNFLMLNIKSQCKLTTANYYGISFLLFCPFLVPIIWK